MTRPPVPPESRRDHRFQIRVNQAEHDAIKAAAAPDDESTWARRELLKIAASKAKPKR